MRMPESHYKWEVEVAEQRMSERHQLVIASRAARNKKTGWIRSIAESMRLEICKWHYRPRLEPPDIEIAWIIHSHIAWKGSEASPLDLWDDLADTDPTVVIAAEKEGPDSQSPIPQSTILLLVKVLNELESFGYRIKGAKFSENWQPITTSNKGGPQKKLGKLISSEKQDRAEKPKPEKWQYKQKLNRKGSPLGKSSLLTDFFELKT